MPIPYPSSLRFALDNAFLHFRFARRTG
jgi:hypothetical protein